MALPQIPGLSAPAKASRKQIRGVAKMLSRLSDDLDRIPRRYQIQLLTIVDQARRETQNALRFWSRSVPEGDARYTAQHHRILSLQLDQVQKVLGEKLPREMAAVLSKGGRAAQELAVSHLVQETARFSEVFGGMGVAVNVEKAAAVAGAERQLIHRYKTSAQRYGGALQGYTTQPGGKPLRRSEGWIERIRKELGVGALRNETMDQITDRLVRIGGPTMDVKRYRGVEVIEAIPEGLFQRYRHRAETVVRTELLNAANLTKRHAIEDLAEDDPGYLLRWDATADRRLCPICNDMDGKLAGVDRDFDVRMLAERGGELVDLGSYTREHPPAHPNCLLPGTRVRARAVAGLKARYDGPAVEVKTRGGARLSVTPNHPVVTSKGVVPAGKLRKGDQLLSDPIDVKWASGVQAGKNKNGAPPEIEQVFRALSVAGPSLTTPTADNYLHGDGRNCNGNIHIVGPDRVLLAYRLAAAAQRGGDLVLPVADMHQPPVPGSGGLNLALERPDGPAHGAMGCTHLRAALLLGHAAPLHSLRLGPAAELDAPSLKTATEDASVDPSFVADMLQRFPGQIDLDEVVEIRDFHFSGHVYDLQSEPGWIVAQGIVISNCRCALTAWRAEWGKSPSILGELEGEDERRGGKEAPPPSAPPEAKAKKPGKPRRKKKPKDRQGPSGHDG